MSTIIKNGNIATSEKLLKGDIYIEDGIIVDIGENIQRDSDNIIDASNMYVVPGGVDVHTHLNLHTGSAVAVDDFYTGTVAAAFGGTTSIVDHIGFGPQGCSLKHQIDVYYGYADNKAVVDYGFHGVIQHVNDHIINEMKYIVEKEGVTSFKIYLTYDFKLEDQDILRTMKRLGELGAVTAVHCENDGILNYFRNFYLSREMKSPIYHALSRPEEAEEEAVNRMITLASLAGNAPLYIVHDSTAKAAKLIENAKKNGRNVFGETCPQYLFLDETLYNKPDNEGLKYIMSPPLRKKFNQDILWKYIENGTLDVVATDHCPFNFNKEKQYGIGDFSKCPNGAPGIETRLPLLFSEGVMKKRISINKFVDITSTKPAKIFGLYPKKGDIKIGSDADIVIIDPKKNVTIKNDMLHENVDYTCYENFELQGYPVITMSRGEVIVENEQFKGKKGRGKFIRRSVSKV
ncbi:dihydropyrimidinase [Clostridium tyrobutyricum]|uniref:dihydropyrimidinase n=1 Tax=Clostridium tyrobutyricum TaxID=1519 RepID=UPI0011CC41B4|nr:dihydropyrimidinase [Clostridium tyrobutyricum]